jgi:SAM-dependent methyltransferase
MMPSCGCMERASRSRSRPGRPWAIVWSSGTWSWRTGRGFCPGQRRGQRSDGGPGAGLAGTASSDERVLDLFCGLGNFALPLARQVREVVAVEGVQAMVDRAALNAVSNNLHNVQFFQADLSQPLSDAQWAKAGFCAVLLDPPRDGALEVVRKLATWGLIAWCMCPAIQPRWRGTLSSWSSKATG